MSGEENILVNRDNVESDASRIQKTAQVLYPSFLNPKDENTTLHANTNLHHAFKKSQSLIAKLATAIDKEALNIRSIGATFEQYDAMLANLTRQG